MSNTRLSKKSSKNLRFGWSFSMLSHILSVILWQTFGQCSNRHIYILSCANFEKLDPRVLKKVLTNISWECNLYLCAFTSVLSYLRFCINKKSFKLGPDALVFSFFLCGITTYAHIINIHIPKGLHSISWLSLLQNPSFTLMEIYWIM